MPEETKVSEISTEQLNAESNRPPSFTIENEIHAFERGQTLPAQKAEVQRQESSDETKETSSSDDSADKKSTEKKSINLENFSEVLGETSSLVKKLKEEEKKKPEDEKKDKSNLEDGQKTTDKDKEETEERTSEERASEDNKGDRKRNLEGFGEQEQKWLQRMPFEAYEYFSKVLKESRTKDESYKKEKEELATKLKDLEAGKVTIPESYYENPDAFVLTPEYKELSAGISLSRDIENHWREQLVRIEKGEEWYDLIEDPKTGNIYIDTKNPKEPDSDAKISILSHYNGVQHQTQNLVNTLNKSIEGFKEKSNTFRTTIRNIEKQTMPIFEDEKAEEYKRLEAVRAELPKVGINKNNPVFDLLAKSCAMNLILRDLVLSMESQSKTKNSVANDQKRSGPTQSSFSGGNPNAGKPKITLNDFKKAGLDNFDL